MRISSSTIFDSNVAALGQQQTRLLQTQQQISTGRRILTAADDPVAAARALDITQSDATNTQYAANRDAARNTLSLAESTLQSVTTLLQDVKTAAVGAGNGSLNNSDRQTIATGLNGRLQELIGLANSTDAAGNYLFSGFQATTQPFVNVAGVMAYNGDDGQRLMQVSASRQMASSDSGADIFMRMKDGNGTFVTQPVSTNTGSGLISAGSVINPAAVTGDRYSVSFSAIDTLAPTGTRSVASGAISGSVVSAAPGPITGDSTATFTVDGLTLFTNTLVAPATGTLITDANLDAAWPAFAAANPGYTLSGSFAAGTAQITKANGTALVLAETQTPGAGASITPFNAAGAGFMGTTAAGTGMTGVISSPATVIGAAAVTGHDYSITINAVPANTYSVQDLTANTTVAANVGYTSGNNIQFDGIQVVITGAVSGDVFNVKAPTYSVTDVTTGLPVPGMTAQKYTSGQAISFGGMQFDIRGIPLPNDQFTVQPSGNVSLFKTISDLITALNTPVGTGNAAQAAAFNTSLNAAMSQLDRGLDNVLTTRSTMGLRLGEIDALQTTGSDLSLQLKQTLSQLQDVDYNRAISDLTQQQMTLQAAQKSFIKVADLSLFSYL